MIQVENLTKTFGPKTAVNNVSFRVERGEVLGFLGPNGAGKSTTMRMVTGFIPPTSGRVLVCGFDVAEQPIEAKRRIGYLPESAPSYPDMSVAAFLGFAAEMRGLRGEAKKRAVARAVEMCFLETVLHQSIDTLSKGFRHRTCLAQALIHDPEVLIMDEPTDGLDPNQKHEVRGLIQSLARERTIMLSTHLLEEVEAIATRALVIAGGRLRADHTPAELLARSRYHGALSFRAPDSVAAVAALDGLVAPADTEVEPREGRVFLLPRARPLDPGAVAARLSGRGVAFSDLRVERGRLDDVFRALTLGEAA